MADFIREGRLFRVIGFNPSHRQLFLSSDALYGQRTTTRIEVYFGHVELMFLKPYYEEGVHIRRASPEEFAVLQDRHKLTSEDARYTWMLERDGDSFVIAGNPSWREAEYKLMSDRQALYDVSKPWPPDFPADSGSVD
ncbi:hypothetical protein [Streptomyces sp. NPDC096934]|uniref:hypothetical protein n=1 Tax=Streptomyces sp. NPDC096934 TaxID=3155551 RepID=UPI0033338384